jgi:hypothetical protein
LKDLFGRKGWAAITFNILPAPDFVERREDQRVVATLAFTSMQYGKVGRWPFKGTTPDTKRDFIERIQNRL